ncbi:MAG TPA: adenylate/guanylate cyclase domain-containing protein, partial [Stellaceae bacterium]|nr:adenylate/guanylate cyclase domain-containing protein [Stellaceae bacterium]
MEAPGHAWEIARWILTDGRALSSPTRFVNGLCARLLEAGVPLWRVTIYVGTLHPQIRGFGWRWWADRRITEEVRVLQGTERTEEYLTSPLRGAIEHGEPLRQRLDGAASEFPLLEEFRAEGCTDYVVAPLNRLGPRYPVVTWATARPGGFAAQDLALLEAIRPALAAVVETIMLYRTARGLFSIYHGRHVGDRIFDGQILRGHFEPLRAVIMATDLRDFTGLSDRLPGEEVIGALDEYFEHVATSVHARGGHILKFVGDGVLAIFGAEEGRDAEAAKAGIAAARAIVALLAARIADPRPGGKVPLRAGI